MFPFFDAGAQIAIAMSALYGLLAATSLSVRWASQGRAPGMLSHQVNAWWRIFPVVSIALLTYPLGLLALAALVCLLAFQELEPHYGGARERFRLGVAAIVLVSAFLGWRFPQCAAVLVPAAIAIQAGRSFALQHNRRDPRTLVWLLAWVTTGAMLVLAAFPSLPLPGGATLAWLFYLFILTALNDIGQFVGGKLFGRHKIAPRISPNKTWEGLAGGILVSQAVSLVLGTYLALAGPLTLAGYALLLSLAGYAGDLMFSAAKRRLSIKDFSTLIPGHGGILDRVDSLVLTAPLLYCLLRSAE